MFNIRLNVSRIYVNHEHLRWLIFAISKLNWRDGFSFKLLSSRIKLYSTVSSIIFWFRAKQEKCWLRTAFAGNEYDASSHLDKWIRVKILLNLCEDSERFMDHFFGFSMYLNQNHISYKVQTMFLDAVLLWSS